MTAGSVMCFVLTLLPWIFNNTSIICAPACSSRDTENNSIVCKFDRDVEENITAKVFFDSPVERIQSLRLEFNSNGKVDSLKFPFKAFFQLGFWLLRELCIVSDRLINNDTSFRMDELQVLTNLSNLTFHVKEMKLAAVSMSLQLNLLYLDVSFTSLNIDELCEIVQISGSALEEVYAESINWDDLDVWILDDAFFSCFTETNLRVLYIPNSNIRLISSPNINFFVPSLEVFDASDNDVGIDSETYLGVMKLGKLKKIIISGIQFSKSRVNQNCNDNKLMETRYDHPYCSFFQRGLQIPLSQSLVVLNIGGSNDCHKINTFYCQHQNQCLLPKNTVLRELYLNNMFIIRMDMRISGLNRLEKLDFSSNQCKYISRLAISEMTSLTTLFLNGNSLSAMEETDGEELRILFQENRNLRFLNLSANGFTRLHSDIFATNTKLEILDLSKNFLHNTDCLSSTVIQLRSLNLNENRLTTIDGRTRQVIDNSAYGYNYSTGEVGGIHLKLANNPISCDCDQEDMLRWLSNTKQYISDINGIVCAKTGGFVSIHTDDMDSYRHSCTFQRYKGLLALCIIPIIAAISAVLYIRYYRHILRIRRIRKQLDEFVEDNFNMQRKFLLYLAYSFSDGDIVLNKIFPELERRLQKEVGVRNDLVCISDRDFDVGVNISDEIIHAVTSSSAVLFIISKGFARSRWCEFEAEIALYQGKPIILVTLGNIKIRSLPASLRKVCFKWSRLQWPGVENQDKLEDFFKKLVKAIIKDTSAIRH